MQAWAGFTHQGIISAIKWASSHPARVTIIFFWLWHMRTLAQIKLHECASTQYISEAEHKCTMWKRVNANLTRYDLEHECMSKCMWASVFFFLIRVPMPSTSANLSSSLLSCYIDTQLHAYWTMRWIQLGCATCWSSFEWKDWLHNM